MQYKISRLLNDSHDYYDNLTIDQMKEDIILSKLSFIVEIEGFISLSCSLDSGIYSVEKI